jgi:hypothetical protein
MGVRRSATIDIRRIAASISPPPARAGGGANRMGDDLIWGDAGQALLGQVQPTRPGQQHVQQELECSRGTGEEGHHEEPQRTRATEPAPPRPCFCSRGRGGAVSFLNLRGSPIPRARRVAEGTAHSYACGERAAGCLRQPNIGPLCRVTQASSGAAIDTQPPPGGPSSANAGAFAAARVNFVPVRTCGDSPFDSTSAM